MLTLLTRNSVNKWGSPKLRAPLFLLVSAAFFGAPTSAQADWGLRKALSAESICGHRMTYSACLAHVLNKKCEEAFPAWKKPPAGTRASRGSVLAVPASQCSMAAARAVKALSPVPLEGESVVFTEELKRLFDNPKAFKFLKGLQSKLIDREQDDSAGAISLWDEAVLASGPSSGLASGPASQKKTDAALEWLGALLQDPTEGDTPIREWLRARGLISPRYRELLLDVMDRLVPQAVTAASGIFPYPYGVSGRSAGYYHFYTIALMAKKMRKLGSSQLEAARMASLLNALYEFRGLQPKGWPWSNPPRGQILSEEGAAAREDLYTGYLGAYWGAGYELRSLLRRDEWMGAWQERKTVWQWVTP